MDNALRCPQPHSLSRRIVQLIELKDREERRRLSWIVAYRERPDAGAVCRRFGISRPTLRKWLRRYEAEGEVGLRALSRRPHHFPTQKVDEALQAAILDLRRAWRLGTKRATFSRLLNILRLTRRPHYDSCLVNRMRARCPVMFPN